MAIPKRTAAGSWRVQIEVRDAATLTTKREAIEWTAQRRAQLLAEQNSLLEDDKTLADALQRYLLGIISLRALCVNSGSHHIAYIPINSIK